MPPRLLILCEGKTEKRLLDQLRGHWRISSADIKICGEVGVPDTIAGLVVIPAAAQTWAIPWPRVPAPKLIALRTLYGLRMRVQMHRSN